MTSRSLWAAVAAATLAGCSETPRAPDLTTEAVYQNDRAGLRFLTPDGWNVIAKSVDPETPRDIPLRLIAYQHTEGRKRAELDLFTFAAPEDGDLLKYLERKPIGPEVWVHKPPVEPLTADGVEAKRYTLAGKGASADKRRELVEFRRGDRVYLFVISYNADDTKHRDQARGVIEKAVWK